MADQNLPAQILGGDNDNAADITAGLIALEGGDTEGAQSDNASYVDEDYDQTQVVLDASQGFDYARARQSVIDEFRDILQDQTYTPTTDEMKSRLLPMRDAFIKRNLEARARDEKRRFDERDRSSASKNENAVLTASFSPSGSVGLSLNFGAVCLSAIALKVSDHHERVNEFSKQYDKLYESVVFAKTNRSIHHPVHRHNFADFESMRRYGITLFRLIKDKRPDGDWHHDATLLTRTFMAKLLAVRHTSSSGEALSVIEFLCARNENKPQFRDGATSRQTAQIMESHFTSLFNLCTGTYSNWVAKVSDGSAEREAWNGRKSSAMARANKEEFEDRTRNQARRNNKNQQPKKASFRPQASHE